MEERPESERFEQLPEQAGPEGAKEGRQPGGPGAGSRWLGALAVALTAVLLFAAGLLTYPVLFSSSSVEERLVRLEEGLTRLGREHQDLLAKVEEVRGALAEAGAQAGGEVQVSADDDPALGPEDAPVLVVEFSDFQCPYCRRFHEQTFPRLREEYIDTGKVRFVYRDFPLTQIHRYAGLAALAAECADEQGRFWEMHDLLFQRQTEWASSSDARGLVEGYAGDLGLDGEAFSKCIDDQSLAQEIVKDLQDGMGYGVQGTPAFFINGQKLEGAQPFAVFRQVIEAALAER